MEHLLEQILKEKVIVIVRKTYGKSLLLLSEALLSGGLHFMEVTFDQSDPLCIEKTTEAIQMLNQAHTGCMTFGAGTVLTVEQVDAAASAGASFIISPNCNPAVIRRTKELGLLSIPGAMTPTEILAAHDCGADLVKLFPAASLGTAYIKDILAPISHVKMIATAGVTEENFGDFLSLGLAGAGIGGRLTDKNLIASADWAELSRRATAFLKIAQEY